MTRAVIAVAGTGTDVGKTFVAAALLQRLREKRSPILARKPVQSFVLGDIATDADVLARASGELPTDVCPAHRWLQIPLAPPMAAEALGLPSFAIADLTAELLQSAPATTPMLVETAGGVRSPIAADGDSADLIDALEPALVVLVGDAGLGTINLVRMSVDALRAHRVVVYLNRFDRGTDLHVRNADWLRAREGLEVVTDVEALAALMERILA